MQIKAVSNRTQRLVRVQDWAGQGGPGRESVKGFKLSVAVVKEKQQHWQALIEIELATAIETFSKRGGYMQDAGGARIITHTPRQWKGGREGMWKAVASG